MSFESCIKDKKFIQIARYMNFKYPIGRTDDFKSIYYECLWKSFTSYSPDKVASLYTYFGHNLKNMLISIQRYNKLRKFTQLPNNLSYVHKMFEKIDIEDMLEILDAEDNKFVQLRFYEGKTLSEIGELCGKSYEAARQQEKSILDRLKNHVYRTNS